MTCRACSILARPPPRPPPPLLLLLPLPLPPPPPPSRERTTDHEATATLAGVHQIDLRGVQDGDPDQDGAAAAGAAHAEM